MISKMCTVSRLAIAAVAVAGLALCVETAAAADRALLIGIDRYRTPSLNLVGSENDVIEMRGMLSESFGYEPSNIKTVLHDQATRQGILDAIDEWLVQGTEPGDRVTLFYSGHGYRIADGNGDDGDGLDETLVPYDVSIGAGKVDNLILDDEIGQRLAKLNDRKVLVIVDSCYSGTLTRGEVLKEEPPKFKGANIVKSLAVVMGQENLPLEHRGLVRKDLPQPDKAKDVKERSGGFTERRDNVIAWSAVSATQLALVDTDGDKPGGVFTKRFAQGLKSKAADSSGDGKVTNEELLEYVRRESTGFCDAHKNDCKDGLSPLLEAPSGVGVADVITNARPATVAATATETFGVTKNGELAITIKPKSTYRLGEKMNFSIRSDFDGYLIVLDINAREEVTQIFPNEFSAKEGDKFFVKAGQPISIPHAKSGFAFEAQEPTGDGTLYAILSQDVLPVEDLVSTSRGFKPVADARSFVERLGERLREIAARPRNCEAANAGEQCQDRPIRWWATSARYRIEP